MGTEKATNVSNIAVDDEIDEEPGEVVESAPPLKVGEERVLNHTSGLKKKLIKRGIGLESPEFGDEVTIHYVGTLLDGTKFDSSRDSDRDGPFNLKLGHGNVAIGLDHGIITMKKGEIALFTLPPELGYGSVGRPGIPPDSNIQFEVELISWITVVDVCNDGGIIKKILEKGEHIEQPGDLDEVLVKYQVMLADGTIVEKTPEEGTEFYVKDGHFCAALPKAIKTMRRGEKVKLLVQPQCVLPWCETPPHKDLLDRILQDSDVNRSLAYLLGYTQPNPRVRQTGSNKSSLHKKAPVYRNTTDEASEESISDSSSEFEPNFKMSNANEDPVAAKIHENAKKYRARMDSNKLRAKKISNAGAKGKAVVGSSRTVSPCLTDDVLTAPVPKSTPVKSKVYRTPSFFDVDRCARWKPSSDIDEKTRTELEKLPRLPKPRKSQDFGVIGTGPTYAQEVLASYMSFDRDVVKLESESSAQNFGAMLQNSAEMMARLSFASHAMVEKEVTLEKRLAERETEVGLLRVAASKFDARQADLVDRAAAEYFKGVKEGELSGWNEAVLSFKEAGHLDQEAIDSVVCHLNMSEGEEENMETDNAAGAQGNVAPINEMFF